MSASTTDTLAAADAVLTERRGALLLITLNRPEQRNAVNQAVADGVSAALDALDANAELRAGILVGAGDGFCAGMDLEAFRTEGRPHVKGRGFAGIVQRSAAKPLIAAIEGFAVAGGLEIALACDLIVAASNARVGLPEVRRGLVPTGGALLHLPRRVPYQLAMDLVLTGRLVEAEQLAPFGLVARTTPPGQALEIALALANDIARNAPLATAAAKAVLRDASQLHEEKAWARQAEHTDHVLCSQDAQEGARAFVEKREPAWQGR